MYPPEYKFTTEHQSAKDGVPGGILANSDWHWDAKKKDHGDDKTFIGNVDYDWSSLSAWALEFAKDSGAPQRWFRFDRERGIIYHSNEIVNGMPYYGQAKSLFETNGYNEHNTQYYNKIYYSLIVLFIVIYKNVYITYNIAYAYLVS